MSNYINIPDFDGNAVGANKDLSNLNNPTDINVPLGTADSSGNTNDLTLKTGDSSGGNSGNINLDPGSASGTKGHINCINQLVVLGDKDITNTGWGGSGSDGPGLLVDSSVAQQSQPWFLFGSSDVSDDTQAADLGFIAGSNITPSGFTRAAGIAVIAGGVADSDAAANTGSVLVATGYNQGRGFNGGIVLLSDGSNPNAVSYPSGVIKLQPEQYVDFSSCKASNVADPSGPQDAATKNYTDNLRKLIGIRYNDASATVAASASNVTFANKDWDTNDAYSGATFTAPIAGVYTIDYAVLLAASFQSGDTCTGFIYKNGALYTRSQYFFGAATSDQTVKQTDQVSLAANDTIVIKIASDRSGTSLIGNGTYNYLNITFQGTL